MDPIRILIVDDHPIVRDGLTAALETEPDLLVVGEAGNGHEALAQLRALQPDVILMDNWIPGPGGIAATKELKSTPDLQSIPVIFFSANSNVTQLAREAQADYFLQKPFDISELEAIVQVAVSQPVGN